MDAWQDRERERQAEVYCYRKQKKINIATIIEANLSANAKTVISNGNSVSDNLDTLGYNHLIVVFHEIFVAP